MRSNVEQGRRLLELPARIADVERRISVLRAEQAALIAELDRGLQTLATLPDAAREEIAVACRIPDGQARTRLATARALSRRLDQTREELAAGRLSFEHATAMARATEGLTRAETLWVETEVLDDPRAITPGQLGFRARQAAQKVAPTDDSERPAWVVPERSFTALASEMYTAFSWVLPTVDAEVVVTFLDATAVRQGRDDQRPGAQRRAEALLELVRSVLDGGSLPSGGDGRRPHLELIATAESLVDGVSQEAQIGSAFVVSSQLRELACDADVRTSLLDANRTLVDQGRTTRVVSARLRARLDVRDRHCRFPGCGVRAPRCRAHHIEHWADGGSTDLCNLILLCERHHHAVHGGWSVRLDERGDTEWTSPGGQLISQPHHLQLLAEPEDLTDGELGEHWVERLEPELPPPRAAVPQRRSDVCPF